MLAPTELAGGKRFVHLFRCAKKTEVVDVVHEVREYIKTINEFRLLNIVERDRNWGLANSIIDGVRDCVMVSFLGRKVDVVIHRRTRLLSLNTSHREEDRYFAQ